MDRWLRLRPRPDKEHELFSPHGYFNGAPQEPGAALADSLAPYNAFLFVETKSEGGIGYSNRLAERYAATEQFITDIRPDATIQEAAAFPAGSGVAEDAFEYEIQFVYEDDPLRKMLAHTQFTGIPETDPDVLWNVLTHAHHHEHSLTEVMTATEDVKDTYHAAHGEPPGLNGGHGYLAERYLQQIAADAAAQMDGRVMVLPNVELVASPATQHQEPPTPTDADHRLNAEYDAFICGETEKDIASFLDTLDAAFACAVSQPSHRRLE